MKINRLFAVAVILLTACGVSFGTALTANRDTPSRKLNNVQLTIKDNEIIWAGAMVAVDSTGELVEASDAASIQVVGRATKYVDNTADGEVMDVDIGVFGWVNGDTVSDANIGDICYVRDDCTVSVTNSGSNAAIAGIVVDVDSNYVWVDTSQIDRTAGSYTTFSASGAATFGSTIGITGAASLSSTLGVAADITLTDANGAATIAAVGFEGNDAILKLDADQGDDNADTWWVESEDADNDLSFVNHVTEAFKITSAGAGVFTTDLTVTGGDITGSASDKLDIGEALDGAATFSRNDAGTFTITAVDNDANADVTVTGGGTGDVTIGDVTDSSTLIPLRSYVLDSTTSRVLTSADYGKLITVTNAQAIAITLTANGAPAGAWIDIAVGSVGSDSCAPTISAATADTLQGPNDVDLDSVTWGAGHRINAYARFWSDGTYWHVLNLGGTTMTYTD